MDIKETNLLATYKTTAAFGDKYAADFPPDTVGGQQFAIVSKAVPKEGDLAAQQISGRQQKKSGVKSKSVVGKQLYDDLTSFNQAAHSLVLLGTQGLDGKFHLPRNHGAQTLLSTARAFKTDAAAYSVQFSSLGIDAAFMTSFNNHITDFETAIATKGAGQRKTGGATGELEEDSHKAAIALHVLDTIVTLKYKNDPAKLAEWVIASHVEKHVPVPRKKKTGDNPPAK